MRLLLWSLLLTKLAIIRLVRGAEVQGEDLLTTYDFVIIGAGTSGLVLANRLSEDCNTTVLVIEFGYLENNASILIPQQENFYSVDAIQHDPDISRLYYGFPIAPIGKLPGLASPIATGATVGGSSTINGMLFDKGESVDYDAWEELGNPGWGWQGLSQYFIKSSNFTPTTRPGVTWNSGAWGTEGPVHASFPNWEWPQHKLFFGAFSELERDIPMIQEANDGTGLGVGWIPNTQDPLTQSRSSARTAYYDPVASRTNLALLTGTKVRRIIFHDKTAVGVELQRRNSSHDSPRNVFAKREVILAAGPVFSPHILQISGIGPRKMLEEAQVKVIHDLPGVGMNLQDTPEVQWRSNFTKYADPDWVQYLLNRTLYDDVRREYEAHRTGPLTMCFGDIRASLSLQQTTPNFAGVLQSISNYDHLSSLPLAYDEAPRRGYEAQIRILQAQLKSGLGAVMEFPFNGWGSNYIMLLQKPFSRGTVSLNTSVPEAYPVVSYNTLANEIDELLVWAIANFTRDLFQTATLASTFEPQPFLSAQDFVDSQTLVKALVNRSALWPSCSHTSGTCAMMPLERGGVVDSDLLVYGVERLRVVDSSIIPLVPSARLVHTVYAVAEKAADIIRARYI